MLSVLHEALVSMFHARPGLAPQLLAASGVSVPLDLEATLGDASLGDATPVEYRADAVVVLGGGDPALAIVVEVQLSADVDKHYTWPVYGATLRARLRCPVIVLVLTPDPAVAAWAARPVEMGGGWVFAPQVVGPEAVPRVRDADEARRWPELAVLGVLAHGRDPDAFDLAAVALRAVGDLDEDRAALYGDLILSALGPAARAALEELMKIKYEFQSDFAKKYFGMGREEGLAEGLRKVISRQLEALGVELDPQTVGLLQSARAEYLDRIADSLVLVRDPAELAEAIRRELEAGE